MPEVTSHPGDPATAPPAIEAPAPRLSRLEIAWLPIVLVALLAIYLPGLGNPLVFDDSYLAEELLAEYASLLPLKVRMLSYGSFVWIHALVGNAWWVQRVFNLLLHVGVVLALWALYREILRHIVPSEEAAGATPYYRSAALGLAIGFFALNPVATYGVAYLIQRSIVMATLFTVLGLWLFMRGLREKKPRFHALAVACYVLAVLSKEHALLAPLAALPLYILVERPTPRRLALLAAAGGLLVAAAGAILYARYGEVLGKPFDETSRLYLDQLARLDPDVKRHAFPLSVLNEAWLFFRYGFDWVVPYAGWMSINVRPPFPVRWLSFPQVLGIFGYVAVVVGGFFLVLRFRDGRALLGVSLLFPALLFPTEFTTVWVQDPFALYRSYLWAIGIPGLVFFVLHGPSPRALLAVGAILAGLLAWQAVDRVLSMASVESVWTDAIEKLPDDPRAVGRWFPYLNRGGAYVERGDFERAVRDYETSAALGDQGMGTFNLGAILAGQGHPREALAAFDRAQKLGYDLYNLPFQRGLALFALGRIPEGIEQMRITLLAKPSPQVHALALLNLGRAEIQLGQRSEALLTLKQLVDSDPRNKEGRYLLGMAYVMNNDPARAKEVLDALIRDDPSQRAYYARALAHFALHRKAEAVSDIDDAMRMGPANANLREWQAKIHAMP